LKLALVTAGFHRLGAAIAARLAEDGWALALHGRKVDAPDPQLAAMLSLHKTSWHGFVADLSKPEDVAALLPAVQAHFGVLPNLLVNNASRFDWDDQESVTAQSLMDHYAVNAAAPVLLATDLAQRVGKADCAARESMSVVNILDQRIRHPGADQLSYTLSKLSLSGATETLARALAPKVRVNAVAPGLVIPTEAYLPGQMEALRQAMPLGRLPEPEDVADAVLWLAQAEVVTGQTLFIDGGAALKSFDRDFLFMGRND
jgi:pteridine reductase